MAQSWKGLEAWAPSLPYGKAPRTAEFNHAAVTAENTLGAAWAQGWKDHHCHLWKQYSGHTAGDPGAPVTQLSGRNRRWVEVELSLFGLFVIRSYSVVQTGLELTM